MTSAGSVTLPVGPSSGFHGPINNSRGCRRKAFHREPPAGPDEQQPLCLRVHLPCSTCTQDALLLCCLFLFFWDSSFLSIFLSISFSSLLPPTPPPRPVLFPPSSPTGDLFFSPVGFRDPIQRERIIRLLSILEDGPREAEWETGGYSPHHPQPPPPPLRSLPCDDVMAFICSRGTH